MLNGLDPEFFAVDGEGYIIPAERFIGDPASGSAPVAYDNAAVEIRPVPASCLQTVFGNTRKEVINAIRQFRQSRFTGRIPAESQLSVIPAGRIRKEDMELPSVQQFGCSPSLTLLADGSLIESIPAGDPTTTPWRTGGFHVHKGFNKIREDKEELLDYVIPNTNTVDVLVGLVDVMMCHRAGWTKESQMRRGTIGYGRAGEFRVSTNLVTPYGETILDMVTDVEDDEDFDPEDDFADEEESVGITSWCRYEYRTLSPWPLIHPMWSWWAQAAVRSVFTAGLPEELLPNRSEVVEAINRCDNQAAEQLWVGTIKRLYNGGYISATRTSDPLDAIPLYYLTQALRNGGFSYYTQGWSLNRAWLGNTPRSKHDDSYGTALWRAGIRESKDQQRIAYYLGRRLQVGNYRSRGERVYFMSGAHHVLGGATPKATFEVR